MRNIFKRRKPARVTTEQLRETQRDLDGQMRATGWDVKLEQGKQMRGRS